MDIGAEEAGNQGAPDWGLPTSCSASQDTSSSRRCCGSMSSASGGLMPKQAASKSSTPATQPPKRARRTEAPWRGASKSHLMWFSLAHELPSIPHMQRVCRC